VTTKSSQLKLTKDHPMPTNKTYVMRHPAIGYDDEVYYGMGYLLDKSYSDVDKANKELRKIQISNLKDYPLDETNAYFQGSDEFRTKIEGFIEENSSSKAEDFFHALAYSDDKHGMSDDNLLKLGEMLHVANSDLVEVDESNAMYMLWDPIEDEPIVEYTESGFDLTFVNVSEDAVLKDAEDRIEYLFDEEESTEGLNGSYEDISESPELLKSLVESNKALNHDGAAITIEDELDLKTIKSLNGLLKKPLYSIKTLSVEEAAKIQEKMSEFDEE